MKTLLFCLSVLLLAPLSFAHAADLVFEHGPMALTFDGDTGALLQINCRGEEIAHGSKDVPPVTFGVGPADKVVWAEQMGSPKLIHQARPSPDTLDLTISLGSYELVEHYRLFADRARLDRSVQLTNHGELVKLRGLAFRTPGIDAPAGGFYRFPVSWPPRSHLFSAMKPGHTEWGHGSIAPALAQLSPRRSLLWASFADDMPNIQFTEGAGSFEVRQGLDAVGYLRPNQPQEMGFVSLEVLDQDDWTALTQMWDWMDSVGLKVPADRPDWVQQAILYSFHPGGTTGSNFHDLGGFQAASERLLPGLPGLGVNAIWVMPIEYKSPYWPLDYYRFMDGLGTADDYRNLVNRAHQLGLHVLQDLVPHGGAPQAVHNVAHPEFMLQREDGSHLDYWLNDFALPAWQQYIAGVADHYVRDYGVDGYRVDAISGSKEPNWTLDIPYARASLAQLSGGLGMAKAIRTAVRTLKPATGAILAEVESTRHEGTADAVYDFGFCYTVCQAWRRMDAADFVAGLQDYLEEQKYSEPRGAVRLRHVESHDSLRSQGWYGVRGMRALYALSAWIDGIPLIYQGMETGNSAEIRHINEIRRTHPEISKGEAFYRDVKCDTPGVFTCLRKLGGRSSVVVINFNRERVHASVSWPAGRAGLDLAPLEYTVLSAPYVPRPSLTAATTQVSPLASQAPTADPLPLLGATAWFVDTIEGRLYGDLTQAPMGQSATVLSGSYWGSIYWRAQTPSILWQNETLPLYPTRPQIGFKQANGTWREIRFEPTTPEKLRLLDVLGGKTGLWLVGSAGQPVEIMDSPEMPAEPDVTTPFSTSGVKMRCVGSEYIVSNDHYSVYLERQGGLIRQIRSSQEVVAGDQDLYGDQPYFTNTHTTRMAAVNDVETGIRIWPAADGLHFHFEGQIRGSDRFALKRPPLWYRNEYVFSDAPRFTEDWAFHTEKTFTDQKAFLTFFLGRVFADHFSFSRGSQVIAEDAIIEGESRRRGETPGNSVPDTVTFLKNGQRAWSLEDLRTPPDTSCSVFMQANKLFVTLLNGAAASMDQARWYEFHASWNMGRKVTAG